MHQWRTSAAGGGAGELELRSLKDQIHDSLLAMILSGELQPGEKISPTDLAASLGVSITPVRDAVNQLAAEGLASVQPRRGTIVTPVSLEDVVDLYEIRLLIEPAAAERAARHATDGQIERLNALANRLDGSTPRDEAALHDPAVYLAEVSAETEFHAEVVHAAGNRRLAMLWDGLSSHVLVARSLFPRLFRGTPPRRGEHRAVAEAITARDGTGARAAMERHLTNALQDAVRHGDRPGPD